MEKEDLQTFSRKIYPLFGSISGNHCPEDSILSIRDKTIAFTGVEVSRVVGVTEQKDGNEANGRVGNVEGIVKGERAGGGMEDNGSHPNSVDREVTKTFDKVR